MGYSTFFGEKMDLFRGSLKNNVSLFIMALSSLLYFLATFLAKKSMQPEDFYYWNVLLTSMGISYTLCFFGSEQLFLRYGRFEEGKYVIPSMVAKLMITSLLIYLFTFTTLAHAFLFRVDDALLFVLVAVLSGLSVFTYNCLRILKLFSLSQVVNNSWKVILFFAVLISNGTNIKLFLQLSMVVSIAYSVYWLIKLMPKLKLDSSCPPDWKSLLLGFSLSLLTLMLLNNFDRFTVEQFLSKNDFSNYVYFLSLTIMPFSIISSYIGFKEVAYLKTKYDKVEFRKKAVFISLLSSFSFTVWFAVLYFFKDFIEISISTELFLPCLIIVVVKCLYSLYSSLFGLKGSALQIQTSNLVSIISVAFAALALTVIEVSFLNVLRLVVAVWFVRISLYVYYTQKVKNYSA